MVDEPDRLLVLLARELEVANECKPRQICLWIQVVESLVIAPKEPHCKDHQLKHSCQKDNYCEPTLLKYAEMPLLLSTELIASLFVDLVV